MNKLFVISLLLIVIFSCSKTDTSPQKTIQAKVASVTLKISQSAGIFWIGESTPINLSVELKDKNGNIISNYIGKVTYFVNEKELLTNQYIFDSEGSFTLTAKVENISSASSDTFTVKNPQKELDKIIIKSGFINKYGVVHTMVNTIPEFIVKGFDKNGSEIPISKGLKTSINKNDISLNSLIFQQKGTQNILANAYGKQSDITFEIRSPRTFEIVRLPIIFHFCPPRSKTEEPIYKKAIETLQNDYINYLNRIFRNQYETDITQHDPNAQDTFIEFYLAETDPEGKPLSQKGINLLPFTRPEQASLSYDWTMLEAQEYEQKRENLVKKWNPNSYLNIILEPYSNNYGYTGISHLGAFDIKREKLVAAEFFNLPLANYNGILGYYSRFVTETDIPYIILNGYSHLSGASYENIIPHEIGHILGLPHTFGNSTKCTDDIHSDGLLDTPTSALQNSTTNCDGVPFIQRNVMSYLINEIKLYFTYDQVTVMRAKIEAGFNLPTPQNKGKIGGRIGLEDYTTHFTQRNMILCNSLR